jgi:hypothetical protein
VCARFEQQCAVSSQLLSVTAVYCHYYWCYYCYATGEQLNHVPKSVMKFGRAMAMNNGVSNYASNSINGTSSSSASRPPPVITATAAVPSQATPAAATGGGISTATATAAATPIEADKQSSAADGSFTSSSMNGGSSSSMNDVGSDVHTLSSSSTATTAAAGTTGTAANGSSSDGSSSSSGLLLAGELQLPVPLGALPHGALGSSAGSGLAITIGSDGSNDLERTDEEMSHVSLEGDELTLVPPGGAGTGGAPVGTNGHAHHYLHHFDEFTNNDIVNQVRYKLIAWCITHSALNACAVMASCNCSCA